MRYAFIANCFLSAFITCASFASQPSICEKAYFSIGGLWRPKRPDVLVRHPLYDGLSLEFGKPGHEDRVVRRQRIGWGRYTDKVLYRGKITRAPILKKQRIPGEVADRVSTYRHYINTEYPEDTLTVTTEDGVFIVSTMAAASGLGMFNYRGHDTVTTFFIPQLKPMKYIAGAAPRSITRYPGVDEARTLYDSPYVLIKLTEGEHDGGLRPEEVYKALSYLVPTKKGYRSEFPQSPVETWLVKAIKPPADDFSNSSFYRFGGQALRVGSGDYLNSKAHFRGKNLILEPQFDNEAINLSDPVHRRPIEIDLSVLE